MPQKFREKRGNATGNNGRRGKKKLCSVLFLEGFFRSKFMGRREEKCPKKEEE